MTAATNNCITVLLVSPTDRSEHIGELHFTSEDAAHYYMTSELPDQPYAFLADELTIYERF